MKKYISYFFMIMLTLIAHGCTEELMDELVVYNMAEQIGENTDVIESFVTESQAIEVANTFFDVQSNISGIRSRMTRESETKGNFFSDNVRVSKNNIRLHPKFSVDIIKDQKNENPLMYIINYPEGGWVIVSATRKFYPVLAYSDENSFELTSNMGPVGVWLRETKDAIKTSETLDDSASLKIRRMWNNYTADYNLDQLNSNLKSTSSKQEALSRRMSQLGSIYGYTSSYRIMPLSAAKSLLSNESEWQSLCSFANSQGSPPEYTIFVGRNDYPSQRVGPLLKTKWHQNSPFNDLVSNGNSAGCAAIATAQVMKYYQHPQSFSWNGTPFNWSNIPELPDPGTAQASLVRLVGNTINTHYSSNGSWTLPADLENGIRFFGFTVTRANHNSDLVRTQLLTYQRPVIMGGGTLNLPNPLNYLGNGHFWVCDGAHEYGHNVVYFMELINTSNETYYTHPYIYNTSNPFTSPQYKILQFYMNWGWGGSNNGWFLHNDVNSGSHDFKYGREDFYINK